MVNSALHLMLNSTYNDNKFLFSYMAHVEILRIIKFLVQVSFCQNIGEEELAFMQRAYVPLAFSEVLQKQQEINLSVSL